MLGSFGNSLATPGLESPHRSNAATRSAAKPQQRPNKKHDRLFAHLLEREWDELPYTMMQITAARSPRYGKRFYWRDQSVQLGEIDLTLTNIRTNNKASTYKATYRFDELRRDITLRPSLENAELRWSVPDLIDAKLTTAELAEQLLAQLATFHTAGLS